MLKSILTYFCAISLIAASPENFDPLDLYKKVEVDSIGPHSLQVRFIRTQQQASADIHYNDKNQISKISYSKSGKQDGHSTFSYGPYGIDREEIFNQDNILLETIIYIYDLNGKMNGYKVLNQKKEEILRWEYRYHRGQLYSGIRTTESGVTEKFYLRQLSPNQKLQSIFDDAGEKAAEITLSFDGEKILSREFNSAIKRKVEYRYNEAGQLAEVLTSEEVDGIMQVTSIQKLQYK